MYNSVITCCVDCTKRELGCHSKCEEYLKQRAKYDEIYAKRKEGIVVRDYMGEKKERILAHIRKKSKGKKYFIDK